MIGGRTSMCYQRSTTSCFVNIQYVTRYFDAISFSNVEKGLWNITVSSDDSVHRLRVYTVAGTTGMKANEGDP